ncbi:hypothetical protein HanHA300_Chr08g0277541 [Helianthus annuus]|nr:hypothetical protein HanHA300_Chr08g0277541 [Helianthus annuus]KAJ0553296.1 hypothetical protein HanHA89_Chr08g0294841 [Helianthus annuus]
MCLIRLVRIWSCFRYRVNHASNYVQYPIMICISYVCFDSVSVLVSSQYESQFGFRFPVIRIVCICEYPYSVFDAIFVLYLSLNLSLFHVNSLDRFNKFC